MGRPSRFDREFRAHAVELVRVSQKPRCRIASELGVSATTLGKWMAESDDRESMPETMSVSERSELEQLRAEKREWILEREILKKAMAFWVAGSFSEPETPTVRGVSLRSASCSTVRTRPTVLPGCIESSVTVE